MKKKEDLINNIIKEVGATSYLEIGYGNGYNFNKIVCKDKRSVDINGKADFYATSDDFFNVETRDIDCIFIDGLHHADQVRKDIINSLKCNPKVIILHDTIPPSEEHQIVPRKQTSWTGDVWRAAIGFHTEYPEVRFETYRADYGLTCIYPEGKKVRKHFENMDLSYKEFKNNEVEFLNIID